MSSSRVSLPSVTRALSVGLMLAASAAPAATPNASGVEQGSVGLQRYRIPAGALGPALAAYAVEAGVTLSFDPAIVANKTTAGLDGSYTVRQGFDTLLENSGLQIVRNDAGYELRPLAVAGTSADLSQNAAVLPKVRVAADEDGGRTEFSGSYTTSSTNTATKLPLSIRETPQTLTVVTRQKMDDFALTDMDDVLESTSGVHVFERGNNGAFYYSRGFAMQAQYDGLPNPVGIGEWNSNPSPDSAFLDHVEILQGASGLLSGAGEPGGTINLIRKRPTDTFVASIDAQVGSWEKRRLVGDISSPLTGSGSVRGRGVVLVDDAESFVDHVYNDKRGFYGVIEADLGASTTVSVAAQFQQNEGRNHGGVPMGPDGADLHFSRSYFLGNAESSLERKHRLYTISLEQALGTDWALKMAYNHNTSDVDIALGSFPSGGPLDVATGDGLRLMQHLFMVREFTSKSVDLYVSGPLQLFGRRHDVAFGGNGLRMREQTQNSGNVPVPINVYDFDPSSLPVPPDVGRSLPPPDETQQHGLYGVVRLNLADSLKLIVGSRISWYEFRNAEGVRTHHENAVVSPYAGLVFDLSDHYSLYASYSDIFTPQSFLRADGGRIDPVVGANFEAGIKGEFLDRRLNATAAVFRLEQTNLARTDEAFGDDPANICGGWCYLAQDKVISEGVDLALNGELSSAWNIGAGYTYVHSEYASGPDDGIAYRADVPEHILRAFSTYRVATDWTIGANVRVQSRFYNAGVRSGIAFRIEQGGLVLAGLMAKYQLSPQAELGLTIDNLFDRRYFASTNSLYYVPYGEPRRMALTLKYAF